jgi:hypothetical protein
MTKLKKSDIQTVADTMFNKDLITKEVQSLQQPVWDSIVKDVEKELVRLGYKDTNPKDNPFLVLVEGIVGYVAYEYNLIKYFTKPLWVPHVPYVTSLGEVVKRNRDDGKGYFLEFNSYRLFNKNEQNPAYTLSSKTQQLVQKAIDYRDTVQSERQKVEELLGYYVGKDIAKLQLKDELLYEIVVQELGIVDKLPIPDNLADIVKQSTTITLPRIKRLTGDVA